MGAGGKTHLESRIMINNLILLLNAFPGLGCLTFFYEPTSTAAVECGILLAVLPLLQGYCAGNGSRGAEQEDSKPLADESWMHSKISRKEVEPLLTHRGDYLVHESPSTPGELALSVKALDYDLGRDTVTHFIIQQDVPGKYRFEGDTYPSVRELIAHYREYTMAVTKRSDAKLVRAVCRESYDGSTEEEEDDGSATEAATAAHDGGATVGKAKAAAFDLIKNLMLVCTLPLPKHTRARAHTHTHHRRHPAAAPYLIIHGRPFC